LSINERRRTKSIGNLITATGKKPLQSRTSRYRLESPDNDLSDDSVSNSSDDINYKRRPRSAYYHNDKSFKRSSEFESTDKKDNRSSLYLLELNQYGLTKTLVSVWHTPFKTYDDTNLRIPTYPQLSIETSPIISTTKNNHHCISIVRSPRNILLQRSRSDYWNNQAIYKSENILPSCQTHTGSASNLLQDDPSLSNSPSLSPHGQIISVTSLKRVEPSFLNKNDYVNWNIESNGRKKLKYPTKSQWFSADNLNKNQQNKKIQRQEKNLMLDKRLNENTDGNITSASDSSVQRSAPPIL
ncbi:unnamed protein product, partial [Didymodactylos carnosus]